VCAYLICLVGGLVVTVILVALLYRYLSSSGDAKVEHRQSKVSVKDDKSPDTKVEADHLSKKDTQTKQDKIEMSVSKGSDSNAVPESVLGQMKDIKVLKKTATFDVGDQVSMFHNHMAHAALRVRMFEEQFELMLC